MGPQEPPLFELDKSATSEEQLAAVLIEEQRLLEFDLDTASNVEKLKYLAQIKELLQIKQALKAEIDATSPEQQEEQQRQDSASSTSVYKFLKGKSLALAVILLVTVSTSVFISQNSSDPQPSLSDSEPSDEQQPEQQPTLAKAQETQPVDTKPQLLLLEKEINDLIIKLNKKEAGFKSNLKSAVDQTQKLMGKVGHGAAKIKLAEQQAIYDLSQRVITTNNRLTNLQQKKAQADLLINKKQYQAAIPALKKVKLGYQNLLANLNKTKPMYLANRKALKQQDKWLNFKRRYELESLGIDNHANTLLRQANTKRDKGRLVRALSNYKKATQAYHNLLTGPAKQAAIAAKNRQQIIAEIKNEMVKIPLGDFRMGDINGGGDINEQPVHSVIISAYALKKTEVTFEQYDIFADATNRTRPDDDGWGRGNQPVINVSWHDAIAYTEWLSKESGDRFRLPTEAEWEYAARAGHETKYSWGDNPSALHANGSEEYGWPSDGHIKQTAPVASYKANDFGIHDMLGNVQEWTQDCWKFSYQGASLSGKAALDGDCEKRVLRGGSWADIPSMLRSSKRYWSTANVKSSISGFRLAQDLDSAKKMTKQSVQKESAAGE